MEGERENRLLRILCISCLFIIMPFIAYAADMTIGNNVSTTGDWTVTGNVTATSFSGSGSGLTGVTATNLDCTGCVSAPKLGSGAVTVDKIFDGSVTGAKISSGSVADMHITGPISGSKISSTGLNADTVDGQHASAFAASSHNHDSTYQKKYENVAVVALSGGDYADPVTAMGDLGTWCGTPSSTNPCLLKIMPGIYDIGTSSLQMQGYVDIEGSGENITKIKGNRNSFSAGVVNGASGAEIRFLTVENTGGGMFAIALYNNAASPKITNVTAMASGATDTGCGIYNVNSSPTIRNATTIVSGVFATLGIYNYNASPVMTNVTSTSLGGGTDSRAIYNYSSSPLMINVIAKGLGGGVNYGVKNENSSDPQMINVIAIATGSGGADTYGVYNEDSSPIMKNVTATGSGGTYNRGVYSSGSGIVKIDHSIITGSTQTINNQSGVTTYVGNSRLDGGPVYNYGTVTCAGVYDENYTFYTSTCP